MALIKAVRKDSLKVTLCGRCQLEVDENDTLCSNCGHTLRLDLDQVSLEPMQFQSSVESSTTPQAHVDYPKTSQPTSAESSRRKLSDDILASSARQSFFHKSPVKAMSISVVFFVLCLFGISGIYSGNPLSLISAPFVNSAIEKNKNFQSALRFYQKKYSRWPLTFSSMQYENLLNQDQGFYFVLTAEGDYYQVLTAPFFLKDKVIFWHYEKSAGETGSWTCDSQDFLLGELNCAIP